MEAKAKVTNPLTFTLLAKLEREQKADSHPRHRQDQVWEACTLPGCWGCHLQWPAKFERGSALWHGCHIPAGHPSHRLILDFGNGNGLPLHPNPGRHLPCPLCQSAWVSWLSVLRGRPPQIAKKNKKNRISKSHPCRNSVSNIIRSFWKSTHK